MEVELSATHARRLRRKHQLIGGSSFTPVDVVQRGIAFQGQDLPASLRAIALRSQPDTTVADVIRAFNDGELLRSWPMRGTLFATTPHHLATLRHFTAERIHRVMARRREALGLDEVIVSRSAELLTAALAERPRTRTEVLALWADAAIPTDKGRGYHLITFHAIAGLCHWGRFADNGREQLLEQSTEPPPEDPNRALREIVRGFIAARAPVTLEDLAWWTKLPKTLLRGAAESVPDLVEVTVDGVPAWALAEQLGKPDLPAIGVDLLPGFDEWILGYADRSLVATAKALTALVPGRNGVFRPAVLVDGTVVGTWRARAAGRDEPFTPCMPLSATVHRRIERAIAGWPYG